MQLSGKSKPQNANAPLLAELRSEIAARGPVTFTRFMEQALYNPLHGYYSSGRARIGRGGDYFTSVSVGPVFGQLMAAQFAEIRELLGSPADFTIVEQGAHRGEFARDVLQHLGGDVRYVIVEPFAALRVAQEKSLRGFTVEWCDSVPAFRGVHFSNELIDSMPVHLVQWTGTEWRERHVDVNFRFIDLPITDPQLAARVAMIPQPLTTGYETEVNLAALAWIEQLAHKLEQGFIIAADYGFARDEYYAPHRTSGTMQSYAAHQVVTDPLAHAGEADLTAHVEWTSLAEHAQNHGLRLAGFTDQHHFLAGLLHDEIVQDAAGTRALQTLLHPGFLGMKFQFLVLARGIEAPLRGLRLARDAAFALGLSSSQPQSD